MINKISKEEAIRELWYRGNLRYLCHAVQKEMYDLFYSSQPFSRLVWLLARQTGKSYLLAVLAIEAALREPNAIIKVVTDTKIHLAEIFEPKMQEVLTDCPEELKPVYNKQRNFYEFHNGSKIQLAGSDGKHYEKLRGQKSALILIDEAAFCDDLREMIESVLFPTTTHTKGKIVLATTPPSDSEHDFISYLERAEAEGKLTKKTIYDNPLLDEETKKLIIEEAGGIKSERFRREYLVEVVKSDSLSVIPEFTPELQLEIVKQWERPPMFDSYVGMDIGWNDLTIAIFGYYDFRKAKLIIEDEVVMDMSKKENTIKLLTTHLVLKENELWTDRITGEPKPPFIRVSDINPIVTKEIAVHSGEAKVFFNNANKDDKDASLNNLRSLLGAGRVIINPKCKTLIRHLNNVKWKSVNNKKEFGRSADDGHYDGVDALKYLLRAVNFNKNPYPAHFQLDPNNTYYPTTDTFAPVRPSMSQAEVFKKVFKIKKVVRKHGFR